MTDKVKPCCEDAKVRQGMFYWRGTTFSGIVCERHNALFDNPEDSFMKHVSSQPPTEE